MRRLSLICALLINCFLSEAQKYEPQILLITPNKTSFDPAFSKQVEQKNAELSDMASKTKEGYRDILASIKNEPENIQQIRKSTVDFVVAGGDFSKMITLQSQDYLTYRFYERFTNLLILIKDIKSTGDKSSLSSIATENHINYVINFSEVELREKNGPYMTIKAQLFDASSGTLLINKSYNGNSNNPGFEFACEAGTIGCAINNSTSGFLKDVITLIAENSPTIKKERELAIKRLDYISKGLYLKAYDASVVKEAVNSKDSTINLDELYYCLSDPSHSKFAAFFSGKSGKNSLKSFSDNKTTGNIKVITDKKINDPGYLDDMPQNYGYIVKGVKYNDKWYYEKDQTTYFNAGNDKERKLEYLNNLQGWDFFKEDSTEPDETFWEGRLFKKVKDLRKDPNWEKRKDIWESDERENRDYIGLYNLVADQLKKEKEASEQQFKTQLFSALLEPFLIEQKKNKQNGIGDYESKSDEIAMIYPANHSVVLIPLMITNPKGELSLRYFIVMPQAKSIYEWTYLQPKPLTKGTKYVNLVEVLNSTTKWDYSYLTLDDDAFWKNLVITKQNGVYQYLKELK
nr:hypothetical protein [uncultured Mucilaginibacter sp.]